MHFVGSNKSNNVNSRSFTEFILFHIIINNYWDIKKKKKLTPKVILDL